MNRVVVGVVGLAAAAAVLVGCSDDKGGSSTGSGSGSQVSTGGSTEVKIDGDYVRSRVEDLAKNADLSRFIL